MSIIEVPFDGPLGLGGVSTGLLLRHAALHAGTDPVARERAMEAVGLPWWGHAVFVAVMWYGIASGDVSTWDSELVLGELERRRDARGGGLL